MAALTNYWRSSRNAMRRISGVPASPTSRYVYILYLLVHDLQCENHLPLHTHTHIYTHIYTHTHIHTHIHTHTAEKGFAPSQRPSQGWAILNSPFIFIEDCSYHQQHSYCRGHYSSSFAKCFPFTCSFHGDCFSISARSTPFLFHIILFLLRVVPRRTTSPCCPEI